MWIRIYKIWSMQIRIQDNKITKFISNHLKVKKKNVFSNLYLNLIGKLFFFSFRLEKYNFLRKTLNTFFLVEFCFFLHYYISGSTSLPLGLILDLRVRLRTSLTSATRCPSRRRRKTTMKW